MKKCLFLILYFLLSVVVLVSLAFVVAEPFLRKAGLGNQGWKLVVPIMQPDPDLGWVGRPNVSSQEKYWLGNKNWVSVFLQIDKDGFRAMSQARPKNAEKCVVLLGDSNAFGVGVDTAHTIASQLQSMFGARVAVFNFGFPGYGPHQTLRSLELERERKLLRECKNLHFTLLAMEEHISRVTGRLPWIPSTPKYRVEDGHAVYSGPFFPEWMIKLNKKMEDFVLTGLVLGFLMGYGETPTIQDWQLYDSVLAGIQELIHTRYHSSLTIIYLMKGQPSTLARFAGFKNPKLKVEFFEDLVGDRGGQENVLQEYYLADHMHLNNNGNEFLANLIFRRANNLWKRNQ